MVAILSLSSSGSESRSPIMLLSILDYISNTGHNQLSRILGLISHSLKGLIDQAGIRRSLTIYSEVKP